MPRKLPRKSGLRPEPYVRVGDSFLPVQGVSAEITPINEQERNGLICRLLGHEQATRLFELFAKSVLTPNEHGEMDTLSHLFAERVRAERIRVEADQSGSGLRSIVP
jgi:hypothetical protein